MTFLLGLVKSPVLWVVLGIGALGAAIYGYGEYRDTGGYDRRIAEELAMPQRIQWLHDTTEVPFPVYLPPRAPGTATNSSLRAYADSLLNENVSKDSLIRAWSSLFTDQRPFETSAAVEDTNYTVTISGRLSHSFSHRDGFGAALDFNRVVIPVKIIDNYFPPMPYRPNLIDLFIAVDVGGTFGASSLSGMARTGVDLNLGSVQISGGLGAASHGKELYGLWTVGAKVSTR